VKTLCVFILGGDVQSVATVISVATSANSRNIKTTLSTLDDVYVHPAQKVRVILPGALWQPPGRSTPVSHDSTPYY